MSSVHFLLWQFYSFDISKPLICNRSHYAIEIVFAHHFQSLKVAIYTQITWMARTKKCGIWTVRYDENDFQNEWDYADWQNQFFSSKNYWYNDIYRGKHVVNPL